MKLYRCPICGNVVELVDGDIKHVMCCGKPMQEIVANEVDAAVEKHVPVYEIDGDEIIVKVGEVYHPMEDDHYIEWIAQVTNKETTRIKLNPGDVPEAKFKYVSGATLYAFCNKHGLWKNEVK